MRARLTIFLFSLLVLTTSSQAQKKDYKWGYIVNHKGDTLKGWVKDRSTGSFGNLYSRIKFKNEKMIFRKKYGANRILGYGYSGQVFESVPLSEETRFLKFRYTLNGEPVFLKVISRHEMLTYYWWEYMEEDNNYIDFIPLFHKPNHPEMVRVTQGILGLKKKRLMEYFYDCQDLVIAIDQKLLKTTEEVYEFYTGDPCSSVLR